MQQKREQTSKNSDNDCNHATGAIVTGSTMRHDNQPSARRPYYKYE
jgi:hypothetical protein